MINKELIKQNFSHYAGYYDRYSSVQNLCALKLIAKIQTNGFRNILDIGCGTGNYTRLLRNKFPHAQIKALDISQNMVEIAKAKFDYEKIEFIVADAEKAENSGRFDLISSNVSFQWFEDLRKALFQYKELLKEKGVVLFSIFGPDTFVELNSSLAELYGDNVCIASRNFIGKDKIVKILERIFKQVTVTAEILSEEISTLWELLRKIKYTGARGEGINRKGFWTPRAIDKLEEIYRKRFGKIIVTYQVFFCQAS